VHTLELAFEIVFFALAIPAFIADVLAGRSDRARHIGRICTGLLMLLGGAAVNAISLAVELLTPISPTTRSSAG
jgi:hypothetical protein